MRSEPQPIFLLINFSRHLILRTTMLACSLAFLSLVSAAAFGEPATNPTAVPIFATGQSSLPDPKACAAEAAGKAKAALGAESPKLVIVFCAKAQFSAEAVDGAATIFDKKIIYGCETSSPITQDGDFADQGDGIQHGIAVMAIGGNCTVTVTATQVAAFTNKIDVAKVHYDNGKTIGDALKTAYGGADPGKFVITFGSEHAGAANESFAKGVLGSLDKDVKMVGTASGNESSRQIVQGELVKNNNIGILITGKFKVITASSKDEPVKAAGDLLKAILPKDNAKASLVFFVEDHIRRRNMAKAGTLAAEFSAIANSSAGSPIFGMYDAGEIGPDSPNAPSAGQVMHTVVAAILPQ